PITDGALIQAKGICYSVTELLGQDKEKADRFTNGSFVTIYLSPKDYHRIHTPLEGQVLSSTYVPGTLFPVNPFGVRAVKGLFARNERLITYLASKAGLIALVKVGATIVGSVKVNYGDETTNLPGGKLAMREYSPSPCLGKGEELGRFELGSTVILLFEPGRVQFNVREGERVLMGQQIGEIKP
ncbi:MAG TPA: archaetidylserine decarboxylase, partial [Verrucomicrobiae bacterium]|nr:archaetidylserine decarboxylase [Verrucomicrobiae bacterium]